MNIFVLFLSFIKIITIIKYFLLLEFICCFALLCFIVSIENKIRDLESVMVSRKEVFQKHHMIEVIDIVV